MFRKSVAVLLTVLVSLVALTACGQNQQQKSCDASAANPQGLFTSIFTPDKAGGGHGGSSDSSTGHDSASGRGTGDHANSGKAHVDLPHPPSAPDEMPAPQTDPAYPGYVKYQGWPGYYRVGTFPYGFEGYYDCYAPSAG